jgi:hypothetical protein
MLGDPEPRVAKLVGALGQLRRGVERVRAGLTIVEHRKVEDRSSNGCQGGGHDVDAHPVNVPDKDTEENV